MFVTKSRSVLVDNLRSDLGLLRDSLSETGGVGSEQIDADFVKSLVGLRDSLDGVCAIAMGEFARGDSWAQSNYLTGKTAIVHETGISRKRVESDLLSAKVLSKYPVYMEALCAGKITADHIKTVAPLLGDRFVEFFDDDCKLLLDTASSLPVSQFQNVVRHWKNMVDAIRDDVTDDKASFESRKLFFDELVDGQYFIHGQFDPINGKIIKKALEQVTQKLWNDASPSTRREYFPSQMRADALTLLAQNFVGDKMLTSPTLSVDILLDIADIVPGSPTADFLGRMIEKETPIVSTHTKAQLKQILCDCEIAAPIKLNTGRYDLGRKVRTAPAHMKKQLLLETQTCSVKGCATPSKWCDAHHIKHWIDGGRTSLDNLVLLCRRHHTITHQNKNQALKLNNSRILEDKVSTLNKGEYSDLSPPT